MLLYIFLWLQIIHRCSHFQHSVIHFSEARVKKRQFCFFMLRFENLKFKLVSCRFIYSLWFRVQLVFPLLLVASFCAHRNNYWLYSVLLTGRWRHEIDLSFSYNSVIKKWNARSTKKKLRRCQYVCFALLRSHTLCELIHKNHKSATIY